MSVYKLNGSEALGIEFGSTRIKAVLINNDFETVASGSFDWENKLVNGVWTYDLADVWHGLQTAYSSLNEEVKEKCGEYITSLASIGFSAMMHGYLPFDENGNQLCERSEEHTSELQSRI